MDGAMWGTEKHMAAKKIQYSVSMYANPMHEGDPKKAYASIQLTGRYSTKDLCKHISDHNGLYPRSVVEGVLIQLGSCIRELVLQGYSVVLGEVGTITPTISSTGALSLDKFTSENITRMGVNFTPGEVFNNLRDEAVFEQTTTRAAQAAALEAAKKGLTTADWTPTSDEGEGEEEPEP